MPDDFNVHLHHQIKTIRKYGSELLLSEQDIKHIVSVIANIVITD